MNTRNMNKSKKEKDSATVVTIHLDTDTAYQVREIAERTDMSKTVIYRAAIRMALQVWQKQPQALMEALANQPITFLPEL